MAADLFGRREGMGKVGALKLSQKQRDIIVTADKNLCVSAGAGSGKTLVLVERFAYLVTEKGIRPDRIAAVTYTEKAANHMKERLVKIFTERGFFEERRALENAYISTIHGFASRLLKENPAEAGVDPHFTVLEAGQSDLLMDEVLEEIFEEAAARPEIFRLLQRYNKDGKIVDGIKEVYARVRSMGRPLAAVCPGRPQTPVLWIEFAQFLKNYVNNSNAGNSKTAQTNQETVTRLCALIPSGSEGLSWEKISELLSCAGAIKARGKEGAWVEEMRERFEALIRLETEKTGELFRKSFLELYELFSAQYAARKEESGFLDFDDLLIKAHELFGAEDEIRTAIRDRYRQKFDYIMVDEFQDTNRLQAHWLDRLSRGNNLFVVGDAKQSIYRFRYADLEAFLEKKNEIQAQPQGLCFTLSDNYRSRSVLLEFINGLFKEIWQEEEFSYEELEAGKKFLDKNIPSVEFLMIEQREDEGSKETMDRARVREARALAHRLKKLVEDREIQIADKEEIREVRYGDIAVLLRATTDSAIYEKELRDLDIPYFAMRARGFYDKQEIADLVNFLTVLEKPYLDIPLAAVLRSPLAGLSEDALFWLSRIKEKSPETPLCAAFHHKETLFPLSLEDAEKLEFFIRLFEELAARKDKHRISGMLLLIVQKTCYDVKILGKPEGKRKLANVKKLIDMARDFETREAFGLSDFVRYVKKLSIQDVRESEAQVELEKGEAVKLLSIHKAKGLEFPVVVVADLGRELDAGETLPVNFTETYGLGMKIKNEATRSWEEDFGYRKNKELDNFKEKQELKRLFYVALTRAKEHLILSGAGKGKEVEARPYRELRTWADWLRRAFKDCGQMKDDLLYFKGVPVRMLEESAETPGLWGKIAALAETEPFHKAIQEVRPIDVALVEKLPRSGSEGLTAEALSAATQFVLRDYYETRDLPVSALLKFDECPGCYFDIYEMRAPEEREEPDFAGEEEDGTALKRREFGIIFHRILQHFDFKNPARLEIERQIKQERGFLAENDLKELEKGITNFVNGEWGVLARKSEIYRELPFIYKLPHGQVRGQIDLVMKTPGGEWLIVDYKTGRVASEKEFGDKAKLHEPQILIYALALHDIVGPAPARGILYFTAPDKAWSVRITEERIGIVRKKMENTLEAIALAKSPFTHSSQCKNRIYVYG